MKVHKLVMMNRYLHLFFNLFVENFWKAFSAFYFAGLLKVLLSRGCEKYIRISEHRTGTNGTKLKNLLKYVFSYPLGSMEWFCRHTNILARVFPARRIFHWINEKCWQISLIEYKISFRAVEECNIKFHKHFIKSHADLGHKTNVSAITVYVGRGG